MKQGDIFILLHAAVRGFLSDPPDSEFQRGYLCAIVDLVRDCQCRHRDFEAAKLLAYGDEQPPARTRPRLVVDNEVEP